MWIWIIYHLTQAASQLTPQLSQISNSISQFKIHFARLQKKVFGKELKEITENNSVYVGTVNGGQRSGFGKFKWEGGEYEGEWAQNLQEGVGKLQWADGNVYFGEFVKEMREGIGEFMWKAGNYYCGEWKSNFMHGFGRYLWRDGKEYIGNWKEGLREGFGKMTYNENKVFEGQFRKDKPNGIGVLRSDGSEVRGKWVNGKLEKK